MGKQLSSRPKLSTSSVMESEKESLMETLPIVGKREEAGEEVKGGKEGAYVYVFMCACMQVHACVCTCEYQAMCIQLTDIQVSNFRQYTSWITY